MGIYDREYYRREGPSFLEAISRWGIVCKWLIAINACLYIAQLTTRERLVPAQFADAFEQMGVMIRGNSPVTEALVLNVPKVMEGQVWRLLTYAFLHDPNSPWHIIFNMLALWWFGTKVEDLLHAKEFLAFYLVAAVMGGVAFTLAHLSGLQAGASCLGASAAVMAVMMVCACHYPNDTILIFWVLPVPIWLAMVLYVVNDVTGLLGGAIADRTAFSAHLGGAGFGFLYYRWQWRIMNLVPDFNAWRRERARPSLRIYREEESQGVPQVVPAGGGVDADEYFEAKQEAILEKILRFGENSMTDTEREFMKKAAERAKAKLKNKKKPPNQE